MDFAQYGQTPQDTADSDDGILQGVSFDMEQVNPDPFANLNNMSYTSNEWDQTSVSHSDFSSFNASSLAQFGTLNNTDPDTAATQQQHSSDQYYGAQADPTSIGTTIWGPVAPTFPSTYPDSSSVAASEQLQTDASPQQPLALEATTQNYFQGYTASTGVPQEQEYITDVGAGVYQTDIPTHVPQLAVPVPRTWISPMYMDAQRFENEDCPAVHTNQDVVHEAATNSSTMPVEEDRIATDARMPLGLASGGWSQTNETAYPSINQGLPEASKDDPVANFLRQQLLAQGLGFVPTSSTAISERQRDRAYVRCMERVVVALESAFQAAGKPAPPVPSINYSVELSDPALRMMLVYAQGSLRAAYRLVQQQEEKFLDLVERLTTLEAENIRNGGHASVTTI